MKPPRVQVFPDSRGFFTGRKKTALPAASLTSLSTKKLGVVPIRKMKQALTATSIRTIRAYFSEFFVSNILRPLFLS